MVLKNSHDEYIGFLKPYIPKAIVNNDYLECIRKISSQLPPISFGCFEFWFSGQEARVDFDISINGIINEHKTVLDFISNARKNRDSKQAQSIEKVVQFLEKWSKPEFKLKYFIRQCWLAYDIRDPFSEDIIPWYYIMFTDIPLYRSVSLKTSIILRTLSLLNEPFNTAFKQRLKIFFNALAPSILVSGIGIQTNRSIHSLRIYIIIKKYEDIFSFLKKHGWPGSPDDLHWQIKDMAEGCYLYGLCIDLDPELQPKIGVEFWFDQQVSNNKLRDLTDKLVELGLCTKAKQKAFLEWEGVFTLEHDPNIWSWPDNHIIPKKVILKRLSRYVKIVYNQGDPIIAKGYLGFDRLVYNN